jgi:hypothetical protein
MLAQNADEKKALIVNGTRVPNAAVQIQGRSYVDAESVARLAHGSLSFQSDRVVLTIPTPARAGPVTRVPQGFSTDFAKAAIGALAQMREWKGTVQTVLASGVLMDGDWSQDYESQAQAGVSLASVAASTTSDRQALQLLENQFANVQDWASSAVATRKALNATATVGENARQKDPALLKVSECGSFLNSMLLSGSFSDSKSCH